MNSCSRYTYDTSLSLDPASSLANKEHHSGQTDGRTEGWRGADIMH